MKVLLVFLLAIPAFGQTIANNDSCDIALLPAATLLLPYFEVEFTAPAARARTTLFTVQNTTALPQIARVTLWTDDAYPMLTFNLFLSGYDVQGVNLYDLFANGTLAATSNKTAYGQISNANDQNPHFLPDAGTTCGSSPAPLTAALLADLRLAFTRGQIPEPGCAIVRPVGGFHNLAVGFATIDVVANCNTTSPAAAEYFTGEILFDNVLTGDYQHLNPDPATGNLAAGSPLVHIRAIPPGGAAGASVPTSLPYTFYDVYTARAPLRTQDRRQPLPSAFMSHFISGGTAQFNTDLLIWREASVAASACFAYNNADVPAAEMVRFDEHENATYIHVSICAGPPGCDDIARFSAASRVSAANTLRFGDFSTSGDVAGWLYMNLNNGGSTSYSSTRDYKAGTTIRGPRQSQAWVVTSMSAEGRYSVEMDAPALGNGCSPAPDLSSHKAIGPP